MMRLFARTVRIPDVAYVSWDAFPEGRVPAQPIPQSAPDLAVEVLSKSNTPREMTRKLEEYFRAGTRLVWIIDPGTRSVAVHTAADDVVVLDETKSLTGGNVLPGFDLPVPDFFRAAVRSPAVTSR